MRKPVRAPKSFLRVLRAPLALPSPLAQSVCCLEFDDRVVKCMPGFQCDHNGPPRYLEEYRLSGVKKAIGRDREVVALKRDNTEFGVSIHVGEVRPLTSVGLLLASADLLLASADSF